MANIRFKVNLNTYGHMMEIISTAMLDNDDYRLRMAIDHLKENSYIINDEESESIEDLIVQVKINSDLMDIILRSCIPCSEDYSESVHVVPLLEVFHQRLETARSENMRQAEYDAWLLSCFEKYVVNETEPTCKELAVLINNNELGDKYDRVRYQNIMRPLKAYRIKKFGNKS